MYDKTFEKFRLGGDLTVDEIKKFANLDRDLCNRPKNLSRNEDLLLKYCYAIHNACYYILKEKDALNNKDKLQMFYDMLIYAINDTVKQSIQHKSVCAGIGLDHYAAQRNLSTFDCEGFNLFADQLGLYKYDVIQFALLQAGFEAEAFEDRRMFDRCPNAIVLVPCEHVSVKKLADSILAKLEDESENE